MQLGIDSQIYGFVMLLYSQQLFNQLFNAEENAEWEKTTDAVLGEKIVPMGVAHSELIPMLVKGMQELTARLEKLENSSNS